MGNRAKGASLLVLTVLLIATFLPALPLAAGLNDPPNNHSVNHWAKTWNVTDQRSLTANTVIFMEDHNVTVKNGGVLTIDASKLIFTNTVASNYGLTVESGGTLIIKNKSTLTSNGTNPFFCNFNAGSNILIKDSFVSNISSTLVIDYWNVGIYSESTNLTIDHSLLDNNTYGATMLTINASGTALIKNSTILMHYPSFGLNLYDGSKVTVYDSKISRVGAWSYFGIYAVDSKVDVQNSEIDGFAWYSIFLKHSTGYIYNNKLHDSSNGVYLYRSTCELVGNEIYNNAYGLLLVSHSKVDMHDGNLIYHNSQRAVHVSDSSSLKSKGDVFQSNISNIQVIYAETSSLSFEDAEIDVFDNGVGIQAEYSTNVTVKDSSFQGKSMVTWPLGIFVEYSSTLKVNNCTFKDFGEAIYSEYNTDVKLADSTFTDAFIGLDTESNGTLESQNNAFTDVENVFYLYEATGTSMDDTISSTLTDQSFALDLESFSHFAAHGLSGTMTGANATYVNLFQYSEVELFDCTFTAPSAITLLRINYNSHLLSINSGTKTTDKMKFGDDLSTVDIGWHVDLQTQWQNGVPAPLTQVNYKDTTGKVTGSFITDELGSYSIDLIQDTVSSAGTVHHNSYDFVAQLAGMNGTNSTAITTNLVMPNPLILTLIDTSAPVINIASPAANWKTNNGNFVMDGTALDLGSGLARVQLNDGTGWVDAAGTDQWQYEWNLTEGTYKLEARVTDMAGLTSSTYVNVTVDMTPPALVVTEPTSLYMTSNVFLVNGTTDGVNVTVNGVGATITNGNFSLQVNLTDGAHDITVVATDDVGNTVSVVTHVIVDTVSPKLTSNVVTGALFSKAALTLTGTTDADSVTVNGHAATVDKTNKTWTLPLTLTEGQNLLTIDAMDLAGHVTELKLTVVLDTTPPVITVTSPSGAGPMLTRKATMILVGNVTGASVLTFNGVNVTLDTNGNFSQDVTLKEGQNLLTLVATDLAMNTAKWNYTVILDTKAPVIAITSPATGSLTKSSTVDVKGTVDDTAATLKHGTTSVTNSNGAFTLTVTLTAGANTITITATDAAGNNATATITVTYKSTAALTLTAPTKASITTSKDQITISGTSEAGSKIYVNGVGIPTNADGSFSYALLLKTGKTTVAVKATDLAGNDKTSTFTVTRNAPATLDMMTGVGLAVVLLIVGLIIGLLVGMMMGKSKKPAKAPAEEEEEEEAPEEEEEEEEPEEEEEEPEEDEKDDKEEDSEKDEKEDKEEDSEKDEKEDEDEPEEDEEEAEKK